MANVGAILLAAGASQRFGTESKLLADIGGEPLVRRVARVLVRTALKDLVVVTGHEQRICQQALEGLPVRYVNNTDWQSGMGSSIATGVSALDGEVDGAFIVPGDMPFCRRWPQNSLGPVSKQSCFRRRPRVSSAIRSCGLAAFSRSSCSSPAQKGQSGSCSVL